MVKILRPKVWTAAFGAIGVKLEPSEEQDAEVPEPDAEPDDWCGDPDDPYNS